ncbi:MAG: lipid-A-disaccharide synthase [Desulfobacteraceae bacterium]|nr:lipid-A-disaccharide synthase [Desulfobacteraceae bacterium]
MIIAGEASADLHGSNLVRAIKRSNPNVIFWGIGGRKMERAGVKILVPSSEMAVVGVTEALVRLRTIAKARSKIKYILKNFRPDLLILLDYPEFNLHLAKMANRSRVPVLYYISPQVWAWRRGRVKKIARRVDRMAVILPFEKSFYGERGVKVDYVGHPLMDAFDMAASESTPSSIKKPSPPFPNPVIGLLPGSRKEEIQNLLPAMVKSAEILKRRYGGIRFLLPLAETIDPEFVQSFVDNSLAKIEIIQGGTYKVLRLCHVALVTSGTATLETAIMGVPMVIVYKVSLLSSWVARLVIKVPYIGLVNLVAGKKVVPELHQQEVLPDRLADEVLNILENDEVREDMIKNLMGVKESLGTGGASQRTAELALGMMR